MVSWCKGRESSGGGALVREALVVWVCALARGSGRFPSGKGGWWSAAVDTAVNKFVEVGATMGKESSCDGEGVVVVPRVGRGGSWWW